MSTPLPVYAQLNIPRPTYSQLGDFLRYEKGDLALFWHIERNAPLVPTHDHFDLGSFVLFKNGKQVFADPGRFSYTIEGSYGRTATAHSTLRVDALGAYCEDARLNSLRTYSHQTANYTTVESPDQFVLEITVNGFERLQKPVQWKRTFSVAEGRMTIIDALDSAGGHAIETTFQIAPPYRVERSGEDAVLISGNGVAMRLQADATDPCQDIVLKNGSVDCAEGWFSESYGERSPGTTVVYHGMISGPRTHTYELRWS